MKIHVNKEKVEKKGLFGGGKSWYIVYAHYELNDEETQRLNANKNILSMVAFDFPYRGPSGVIEPDTSPTVAKLTDRKDFVKDGKGCILGCVFTNGELLEAENIVNEGAKALKSELFAEGAGSSVKEI